MTICDESQDVILRKRFLFEPKDILSSFFNGIAQAFGMHRFKSLSLLFVISEATVTG